MVSLITPERILDAAEALFAEHGLDATSMRMITGKAETNLAAINYHFGCKEELIQQVFHRRLSQLNRERIQALDELESRVEGEFPGARQILSAFFSPAVRMVADTHTGGAVFMKLLGRSCALAGKSVCSGISGEYEVVMQRYLHAACQVFPELPREEIAWRLHFMAGAVTYVISGSDALALIRDVPSVSSEVLMERLIVFFLGGLQAPSGGFEMRRHQDALTQ